MITINVSHRDFCETLEAETRELAKTESVLTLYQEAISVLEKIGFAGVDEQIRAESAEIKLHLGWSVEKSNYSLPDNAKLRVGHPAPDLDIVGRHGGTPKNIILSQPVAVRAVIETLSQFGADVMVFEQGTIDVRIGSDKTHGLVAWVEIPYQ